MTRARGAAAEAAAAAHLAARGFTILQSNLRTPHGEIDLLAREGETLVIVEVKWRRTADFDGPLAAVDAAKRRRLVNAALWVTARDNWTGPVRFDVVGFTGPEGEWTVEHLPNAFGAEG